MDEMKEENVELVTIENDGESYLVKICRDDIDQEELEDDQEDNEYEPTAKMPKIVVELDGSLKEDQQIKQEICATDSDSYQNTATAHSVVDNEQVEAPVEQVDFNNNSEQVDFNHSVTRASSPKMEADGDFDLKATENTCVNEESSFHPTQSGAVVESFDQQSNEAEEIIRKLCKNGRIEQVQDHGENCIKLIVCEDSQGSNEGDDTLSAEELEDPERNDHPVQQQQHRNLLQCLTENVAVTRFEDQGSTPIQPYPVNVQFSNTAAQMSQSAQQQIVPSVSFSLMSTGEYVPTANMLGHLNNNGMVPIAFHPDEQGSTPHPRNGYMFYRPNDMEDSRQTACTSTPMYRVDHANGGQSVAGGSQLQLNSSGEEKSSPPTVKQTPTSGRGKPPPQPRIRSLIDPPTFYDGEDWGKIREQHNQKERRRRARIKEACGLLRQLVPGMSDKTDKATVFEFAARYVHFLKSHTGPQFDKDFLMKYSPY